MSSRVPASRLYTRSLKSSHGYRIYFKPAGRIIGLIYILKRKLPHIILLW